MNSKFKMLAAAAWVTVALSSAAPAEALIMTTQSGPYAVAQPTYQNDNEHWCNFAFNYRQRVRFLSVSCNHGQCSSVDVLPLVSSVYSSGRKRTTFQQTCGAFRIYSLGACAC